MPNAEAWGGPPPSRTPADQRTRSNSKIAIENGSRDVTGTAERPLWSVEDLEDDEEETDEETMSLTSTMKLAHELVLLKGYLEIYERFNIHLGDSYGRDLSELRDKKQRGTEEPSTMETIAQRIADICHARSPRLWAITMEKVDMMDEAQSAAWLLKKKSESDIVIGGMKTMLKALEVWEVRRSLKHDWEQKGGKIYGKMSKADLLRAGWILDVGK